MDASCYARTHSAHLYAHIPARTDCSGGRSLYAFREERFLYDMAKRKGFVEVNPEAVLVFATDSTDGLLCNLYL